MATQVLTKFSVEALPAEATAYFVWDTKLRGFGVKVLPSARKVYVIQYRPRSQRVAKRHTIGPHGALTVEQARRRAQELLGEVAAGNDPAESLKSAKEAPTVAGLAPRYITRQGSLRKAGTAEWTQRLFDSYILPALGSRRVADLTTQDAAKLHQKLSGKPVQANRVLAILSAFCSWTEKEGYRPGGSNPCKAVDRYKERGREHFLSAAELSRLGAVLREAETLGLPPTESALKGYAKRKMKAPERLAIDSDAVEAIRLLLFTGCRKSEILELRWSEVDLVRELLVLDDTKTGKSFRPLNAPAREILSRRPQHATSEYVFPGLDPLAPRSEITRAWYRIRQAAGLEKVRLHDLRHTYATVAVGGGSSLVLIGGLLGHTQASTTQRYAHLANDPLSLASERTGADMAAALGGGETPVTPIMRPRAS